MAANFSYNFQDSMDELWFHQNILFWEPSGINFQSLARSTKATAAAASPTLLSNKSSSIIVNGLVRKEKMPVELNIARYQPLFQLQAPRRVATHESHPSTACFDAGSPSKRGPRIPKMARNFKSLSELENYELKGFADLGFVFRKEILSRQLINILPGLQRLGEKCGDSGEMRGVDEEHVKRPYLSEAWSTRRADSPPLNPQILFKPQQAEMQNHLRFWARNVASMVRHDLDAY